MLPIKLTASFWQLADKDGETVKLKLDPKTAEVVKSKPKKGDDDDD